MKNPNCDNDKCRAESGEVRVLPLGGDGNIILCFNCYVHEMKFRLEANKTLSPDCQFDMFVWTDLTIYK